MAGPFLRVLTGTDIDAATLTASSEANGLPVENLQSDFRKRVWRSTALDGQYVDIDFGETKACNALALVNHNLTASGEITLTAGTSAGDNSLLDVTFDAWEPLFGLGEGGFGLHGWGGFLTAEEIATYLPAGTMRLYYFTDAVTARYWRVAFSDPTNPDGYIEAGRILMDSYQEAIDGIARLGNVPVDPSTVQYSKGGQAWRNRQTPYRTAQAQISAIHEEDIYSLWYALAQEVGVGRSFVADLLAEGDNVGMRLHNQLYCHIPQGGISEIVVTPPAVGSFNLSLRESR
jgi:hypothetical protein